ncbi:formin-J isoform X3 [Atheta coriaria]|uniref:formin-J isoform X3 n=1 Tax=Dalotia coriaria TaxID=877792 RepID=UPI0031F3A7DF
MLSTNVLCMKKRKKRSYYVSNVSDYGGTKYRNKRNSHSGVGMMQITEDTPPDMLAGAMDLMVHLPDGKTTKMAVERSTPMMDVLVQITNANHLQISGYILQPLAIHSPPGYGEKVLPYFPNTPIGTLDTQDIRVVAKNRGGTALQRGGVPAQPFESTFRLKVHLPRNQLYVERVSMQAHLHEIMKKMCEEKNLDRNKYEFRHPSNLDQVLDLKLRLNDYQITEVYAVNKGSNRLSQVFSSSDSIMAFRKEDDRRQKSGGGIFNFLKRGKVSNGSGSLSSDNRSISPTHSDDSRSVSPPVGGVKLTTPSEKPKPPQRKRRPAPKPPSLNNLNTAVDEKKNDDDGVGVQMRKKEGLTICHSRNSSDSSGYHEASILSDNANTSLPRKRPQTINTTSNLTAMKAQSKSTSSLAFTSRLKKKAAPPPPPAMKSAHSVAHLENASPVVASPTNEATIPDEDGKQHEADVNVKKNEDTSPPESLASSLATTLSSNIETDIGNNIKDEITEEDDDSQLQTEETLKPPQVPTTTENLVNNEHSNKTKVEIVQSEPAPEIVIKSEEIVTEVITTPAPVILSDEVKPVEKLQIETAPEKINEFLEEKILENSKKDINLPSAMDNSDWEYQLPSPPTAFRDSSPQPDTTTSEESETLSDIHPSTDSILTSPELFEKLHVIKESQSQISESEVLSTKSGDSEEDKFISKLSLENLEIRKKLVYNRELATSLKYQDQDADEVASKRSSVMSELEDILKPSNTNGNEQSLVTPTTIEGNKNWNKVQAAVANFSSASRTDRALPNFKITTYDIPKKKINIFEDDSIRSNVTVPIPSTVGVTEEVVEDDKPSFERQPRQEYNKNRCLTLNRQFLQRSESFNSWTPNAPVKRSKSQVALKPEVPKKTFETITNEENKSRSTLDLTGLQSIEVMKAIRTTLTTTTPTNTTSNTTTTTDEVDTSASPVKPAIEIIKPLPPAKQATPRPLSMFATPSLNFASWKDRKPFGEIKTTPTPTPPAPAPKMNSVTNLNGTNNTNKVISNGTSNNLPKQVAHPVSTNNNVSIKVNGSEPISQQPTGNVLIKIGQPKQQDELTKRYINHSTAVGYRKPLGNINKVQNVRPHSIAIEKFEQFDASRVPIVRAVELKKHAHTNGTSVTQIRPDGDSNKVNIFENVVLRSAAGRKTTERPNSVNVTASSDDRGLLLESIRNFGGKKGLKTVKV